MRFHALLAVLVVAGLAGCSTEERASDLGTGVNTVDRDYQATASMAHDASMEALKKNGLTIESSCCDSLGGRIKARRCDGSEVLVITRALNSDCSRVSIRVEPGDAAMASILHEATCCELGLCDPSHPCRGDMGGCTESDCFQMDLKTAMEAARKSVTENGVMVTHEEEHLAWAVVEGRRDDGNPVRIRMEKGEEPGCVVVACFAGEKDTDENRELAGKLKATFQAKAH